MRAMLLVLVLGCGGSAPTASRSTALENEAPPLPATAADDQLAAELAALPEAHVIYVHPVGWFRTNRYVAYFGTNPRSGERVHVPAKVTVYWSPSPAFAAELAHEPSPILDRYPTEKARYRAAMSLEADPPDDADDPTIVVRPAWSDGLGARLHRELAGVGRAAIQGVGTLEIDRDRADGFVRFVPEGTVEPEEDRD
jgi:nucleoid DNA-binding protein